MASRFEIQAAHHWSFQLVLLGSRLLLEGRCDGLRAGEGALHCSAWLQPQDAPRDVAHALISQPSCCL